MDAVIFDCDGVLVDSEIISLAVSLECLGEIGLSYERADFSERFLGCTAAGFHSGLDEDHRQRFGRPLPEGFPKALSDRIWARMAEEVVAVKGVHDVLAALKAHKAVASSSGGARLEHKLRKTGLFDAFAPHVYSGDLVARGKPAPDLYLHAAEKLGLAPARCVAVEDSLNGVRSAASAGMTVIGFTGGSHCAPGHDERLKAAGAVCVVAKMADLPAAIAAL